MLEQVRSVGMVYMRRGKAAPCRHIIFLPYWRERRRDLDDIGCARQFKSECLSGIFPRAGYVRRVEPYAIIYMAFSHNPNATGSHNPNATGKRRVERYAIICISFRDD